MARKAAPAQSAYQGWTRYSNSSGRSNVVSYRWGPDWIMIRFGDGSEYLYTNGSAGATAITYMKRLAKMGIGLNGYVTTHVKRQYSSKQ